MRIGWHSALKFLDLLDYFGITYNVHVCGVLGLEVYRHKLHTVERILIWTVADLRKVETVLVTR